MRGDVRLHLIRDLLSLLRWVWFPHMLVKRQLRYELQFTQTRVCVCVCVLVWVCISGVKLWSEGSVGCGTSEEETWSDTRSTSWSRLESWWESLQTYWSYLSEGRFLPLWSKTAKTLSSPHVMTFCFSLSYVTVNWLQRRIITSPIALTVSDRAVYAPPCGSDIFYNNLSSLLVIKYISVRWIDSETVF